MADIQFPAEFEAAGAKTESGVPEDLPEPKKPSREELLKRLRAKCSRSSRKTNPKNEELAKQIGSYVNLPPSEIATLIAQSGAKKIAKNPLKFARKVAELLPVSVTGADKKPGVEPSPHLAQLG